jgi:hypothetical protein
MKTLKCYPMIPLSEITLFFGRFISLARLSFREEQRVGKMRMEPWWNNTDRRKPKY